MKNRILFLILILLTVTISFSGCAPFETFRKMIVHTKDEIIPSSDTMKMLGKDFSHILIEDENSAAQAAAEGVQKLGYTNAMEELTGYTETTVEGETFYRLQQNWHGIPVYGRYVVVAADKSGKAVSLSTDILDLPEQMNTEITVTDEQIAKGIEKFAINHWGILSEDLRITTVEEAEKVIYDLNHDQEACIALKLVVENGGELYEVIADGKDGSIKSASSLFNEEVSTGTDGTKEFPVNFDGKQTYTLGNEEKNIFVFYFNGSNSNGHMTFVDGYPKIDDGNSTIKCLPVTSIGDNIFGNSQQETNLYCQQGVELYTNVLDLLEYFKTTFNQAIPYETLYCGYGDQFDSGRNARGGYYSDPQGKRTTIIMWGAYRPISSSTLGHEYTHCVSKYYDAATKEKDPGIEEGLADVFGIFFDASRKGDFDWNCSNPRNAENPALNHYPLAADEENKSREYPDHAYATVISHAMYLMQQSGAFSLHDLEMIWYKTMLRLPSACSYGALRDCMEQTTAIRYGIGSKELEAVQEAFGKVGIITGSKVQCSNDFSLTVYDTSGNPYDNFSIDISGNEKTGFLGLGKNEISQQHIINSSKPVPLHLENGEYIITLTDQAEFSSSDNSNKLYLVVSVNNKHEKSEINCSSPFGSEYTAAPQARLTPLDIEGNVLKNYHLIAESGGKEIELKDGVLNLPEHNNYRIILSKKEGNVTFYDSFTVRIKSNGEQSITRKTGIGGSSPIPSQPQTQNSQPREPNYQRQEQNTQPRESASKANPYLNVLRDLTSRYGKVRITEALDYAWELNGLCYLDLIDFTGDGSDELLAVCKNERDTHYTGYIYTIKNNQASLLYKNTHFEYQTYYYQDDLCISYTNDTGYIIRTGWESDDAEDTTYFWYKDGAISPVYHIYGYWDTDLDRYVSKERSIIVDVHDEQHYDELIANEISVMLRTVEDDGGEMGEEYDISSNLTQYQESIDHIISELEANT